jgi:excisionase family DNA binding protein
MSQGHRSRYPSSEFGTLPEAARRLGLSLHVIRRVARRGAFPIYHCGQSWPRVKFAEVEEWVRSTRILPSRPPEGPEPAGRGNGRG